MVRCWLALRLEFTPEEAWYSGLSNHYREGVLGAEPLWPMVLKLFSYLPFSRDFAMRLPSLMLFSAALVLLFQLAKELFNTRSALICWFLVHLPPLVFLQGFLATPESLLLFASVNAMILTRLLWRYPSFINATLAGAWIGAMGLFSLPSLVSVPCAMLSFFFFLDPSPARRKLMWGWFLGSFFVVALGLWICSLLIENPNLPPLPLGSWKEIWQNLAQPAELFRPATLLFACVGGLLALFSRFPLRPRVAEPEAIFFVLVWFLPSLVVVLASVIFFNGSLRIPLHAWFWLCLLAGAGFGRLRKVELVVGLMLIMAGFSLLKLDQITLNLRARKNNLSQAWEPLLSEGSQKQSPLFAHKQWRYLKRDLNNLGAKEPFFIIAKNWKEGALLMHYLQKPVFVLERQTGYEMALWQHSPKELGNNALFISLNPERAWLKELESHFSKILENSRVHRVIDGVREVGTFYAYSCLDLKRPFFPKSLDEKKTQE